MVALSIPVIYVELRLERNGNNDYLMYKMKYDELLTRNKNSDILVIGTSHGGHGIVPSLLKVSGHSVYNFCFDGAPPSFNYDLYTKVIAKYYTKPRLIIYDVSSFMFDKQMERKFSDEYKYMPARMNFEISGSGSSIMMPYDYLRITHESDIYKALLSTFKDKKLDRLQIKYYDNGFVPNQTEFFLNEQKTAVVNKREEMESFDKLVRYIKSQQVPVIFVETPDYTPGIKHAESARRTNGLIKAYADINSIPFLNYNEEFKSDINDQQGLFSDENHLNSQGARTFSSRLKDDIDKLIAAKQVSLRISR